MPTIKVHPIPEGAEVSCPEENGGCGQPFPDLVWPQCTAFLHIVIIKFIIIAIIIMVVHHCNAGVPPQALLDDPQERSGVQLVWDARQKQSLHARLGTFVVNKLIIEIIFFLQGT